MMSTTTKTHAMPHYEISYQGTPQGVVHTYELICKEKCSISIIPVILLLYQNALCTKPFGVIKITASTSQYCILVSHNHLDQEKEGILQPRSSYNIHTVVQV